MLACEKGDMCVLRRRPCEHNTVRGDPTMAAGSCLRTRWLSCTLPGGMRVLCGHEQEHRTYPTYILRTRSPFPSAENICFEVIDNVQHYLAPPRSDTQIYRARFSGVLCGGIFMCFCYERLKDEREERTREIEEEK